MYIIYLDIAIPISSLFFWLPQHINLMSLKSNPQKLVNAPHMPVGMGPCNGAWPTYQDHPTKEK